MQQKVFGRFLVVVGVVIVALYYVLPSAHLIYYKITSPGAGEIADKAIALYDKVSDGREKLEDENLEPVQRQSIESEIEATSQSITELLAEYDLHFTALDEAAQGKGFEEDSVTTKPRERIRKVIVWRHRDKSIEVETGGMPLGAKGPVR